MPQPLLFGAPATMELPASVPVVEPLGAQVAATSTHAVEGEDSVLAGGWECSPGRWRRKILSKEFSHFIAGHCIFTPDGGSLSSFVPAMQYFSLRTVRGLGRSLKPCVKVLSSFADSRNSRNFGGAECNP